ncbi:MAG: hypothetical protein A3B17_00600 [Candidatus Yanofskybacteria bacterium RIFCSPLOWO2_01_FULL_45_72]|uniref:histidine kinase n=3 Tax=Candidatus Yanofskyibacteriota TaxID=1752733 RepID=A0A1F8H5F4_9BACT|nr:MAG: hypothetical protein A3B17_00600 [Candidatus Yanofskybacteria bacterium RIFCSPLOWO2_01_FULL_45_72]OGN32186.1 MAG: hypothetical protein A3J01_01170 [Candidatus Yanofskybacteria bacterium RIFCSPLOWO2_02_FULL_45_18]
MINVHRKLCMAIVPTAIIGVFLVAVLMHFLTKYALDSILKDTPEHVQIVNLALYRIDVFTIVLAIIATAIFIWITIIRFKKLAEADIGKYLQAMDSARSHIIMTDAEGAIIYANKGAEDITGYTFEEMRGNTSRLWGGLMPREFYKDLWRTVKTELKPFRAEVKNRRKNQDEYYALVCITPILNKAKRLTGFVVTEEDITGQINNQKYTQLQYELISILSGENLTDAMLRDILLKIAESFSWSFAAIWILSDTDGTLHCAYLWSSKTDQYASFEKITRQITFKPRVGLPGRVYATCRPHWIVDAVHDPNFPRAPYAAEVGLHTGFAFPIFVGNRVYAVLEFFSEEKLPQDEQMLKSYMLIGNQMGQYKLRNDEREKLDIAKSEFISLASHQLRTPIAGLCWLIEAMQFNSANLTPKQKEYLNNLSGQSKRMIELVEDLLNISRIELKSPAMADRRIIKIGEFADKFIKSMTSYATLNKHTMSLEDKVGASVAVEANERALNIVMQNLASNAVDYSPENTAVAIVIERADDFIKISIFNRGPAISEDEQPHLFERFYRGKSGKKMKAEGSGLGLYICKKIIEEFGGKIGFESKEGQDTCFWFTIPLK